MSSPVLTVLVTTPDRQTADDLAAVLVGERLAACANILPGIGSVFRWEGEVQRADEVLVILKTTRDRMVGLAARIEELHPYDVPEILALPVHGGSEAYQAWVVEETRGGAGESGGP